MPKNLQMIHYTPEQIFDLLEPENITCSEDVQELSDYVFTHISSYDTGDIISFFQSLEILKEIHKIA